MLQESLSGVRGEWLLPAGMQEPPNQADRLLVWAHGGGFVFCSPGTHRLFLAKVAAKADMPVFCVNYRKPPEHPFPAPGHDVLEVYKAIRNRRHAEKLFLGGDSAGGNLALEVARILSQPEAVGNQPDGLVLLSPWVDLSDTSALSWRQYKDIDFIPPQQAQVIARLYAGTRPLEDEQISPGLRRSWSSNLPPVLLDYGSSEVFRCQIEHLLDNFQTSGVRVDAAASLGMIHGYPFFDFLWNDSGEPHNPFQVYFQRLVKFLRT